MTWRDRYSARGRFRNAEFVLQDDSLELGRRTQVHEYPERDRPYVEDLGRKADQFSLDLYVVGPNYDRARDALIAALREPGPGTLVHPRHGTMRVAVVSARKNESNRRGGMARFSVTFVEAGDDAFPSSVADTARQVEAAADDALQEAEAAFVETYSVEGQPQFFVDAISAEVDRTFADINAAVGDVTGPIASAIREPANMASAIVDGVMTIGRTIEEPFDALRIYERVGFDAGADSPSVPTTTANRQQQANNTEALHRLVTRASVVEAARQTSRADYASREDALSARDRVLGSLDEQMEATSIVSGEPIDDQLYLRLAALRAQVAEDIRIRGVGLPRIGHIRPQATLPALVLAYRVYGDASRDSEIVARNHIRHPGFVPGGERLEVLRDG